MAVPMICLVTVTLESLEVLGVIIPVGVDLLVAAPLPTVNGNVGIDLEPLLGVDETLTVPCPSADFEVDVDLSPLIVANLVIQVEEVV